MSIYIPGTIKKIDSYAFADCTSLSSVLFGYGVETIGVSAFENCTSLQKLCLPGSVTLLGGVSFKNSGVREVFIQEGLRCVDVGAFDGVPVEHVYYSGTEEEIVRQCQGAGYDEALLYEKKLLTITAMEKLMGKKQFNEVLGNYVEKPQGKPTLAPEEDKRPAIVNGTAEDDFAGEFND